MNGRLTVLLALFAVTAFAEPATRVFRPEHLLRGNGNIVAQQPIDEAAWLWGDPADEYLRFRRDFVSPGGETTIDVSADERFLLFLDGQLVARGPNRGEIENWQYQTYRLTLPAGRHLLEAVVWRIGEAAPFAQLSWRGGFILKASGVFDALLTTGKGDWQVGVLKGTAADFTLPSGGVWGGGAPFRVRGTGLKDEQPAAWKPAGIVRSAIPTNTPATCSAFGGARKEGWILYPAQIRDQLEIECRPGSFRLPTESRDLSVRHFAAHTRTEILWDLENYYCAYPKLVVRGGKGATVTWSWTEALRDRTSGLKSGDRNAWKGLWHKGIVDAFCPDGRERAEFSTPWFRCGRWVKIVVETADAPLDILDLSIIETRYPLEDRAEFQCGDSELDRVRALCARGMQMCAHEMLFDCPYYEQQMYPGDTRVQLNVLQAMGADDQLIRRVIDIFDYGRRNDGSVPMNWPTRTLQEGLTFTMCELMMFADYARYGSDHAWLRARLPGMRQTLSCVESYENGEGLLANLPGWSFMDWVPGWTNGVSPSGSGPVPGAINNLYWALVRVNAAAVERALGNELAAQIQELSARRTFAAVERHFWDERRGLYADTMAHDVWSEQAQAFALLTGLVAPERAQRVFANLVAAPDLARCTVYSSFYLFETYFKFGRGDLVWQRLDLWREYVRRGLSTPLERPDHGGPGAPRESRSDCHGWGAHPLVALQRGFAGVTSAAPFFERVRVRPCPGPLRQLRARTPHPRGEVETDLRIAADGSISGTVTLPAGITGEFIWHDQRRQLNSGANRLEVK